jgi:hypothetical protein
MPIDEKELVADIADILPDFSDQWLLNLQIAVRLEMTKRIRRRRRNSQKPEKAREKVKPLLTRVK